MRKWFMELEFDDMRDLELFEWYGDGETTRLADVDNWLGHRVNGGTLEYDGMQLHLRYWLPLRGDLAPLQQRDRSRKRFRSSD